jgi:hypothetical protein
MDKGTAQGRRFGTTGCWTEDWETANVGDASLFEKPRSGARKKPRFLDIADSDDNYAYDANCDSGASDAMKHRCQLSSDDDSAYCTNETRYRPNKSQQRRLHASSATIVQSHAESTRLIQKPKND